MSKINASLNVCVERMVTMTGTHRFLANANKSCEAPEKGAREAKADANYNREPRSHVAAALFPLSRGTDAAAAHRRQQRH